LNFNSEILQAKTVEFTCTDEADAESIRRYVTENIPLPTSCLQPRTRLVSATCHSPQHARQTIQLFKSIADNHGGIHVRFGISFSQQQVNHVWTVGTSGQNALIYASSALLLAQITAQLPEQAPKRQRTEHEKKPRSVDTEEGDSTSEAQRPGPRDDQPEPETDLSGSEYDPLDSNDEEFPSSTELVHTNKNGEVAEAALRDTILAAAPSWRVTTGNGYSNAERTGTRSKRNMRHDRGSDSDSGGEEARSDTDAGSRGGTGKKCGGASSSGNGSGSSYGIGGGNGSENGSGSSGRSGSGSGSGSGRSRGSGGSGRGSGSGSGSGSSSGSGNGTESGAARAAAGAGAAAAACATAGATAGSEGEAAAGARMAPETVTGAAAVTCWLMKAVASNMYDHWGRRRKKRQRACQWTLMVCLQRQERRRRLWHQHTGQRRFFFHEGAQYDKETEDAAEAPDGGSGGSASATAMTEQLGYHNQEQKKNWHHGEHPTRRLTFGPHGTPAAAGAAGAAEGMHAKQTRPASTAQGQADPQPEQDRGWAGNGRPGGGKALEMVGRMHVRSQIGAVRGRTPGAIAPRSTTPSSSAAAAAERGAITRDAPLLWLFCGVPFVRSPGACVSPGQRMVD